jgi:2-polyprenyl-3-methyl-5-hydroxy-6-metoxy-1,4-benzoquinol methylase
MITQLFRRPDRIARRVFSLYSGASRRDRMHLRVRWATCPVPAIDAEVATRGRVLEVGCGHGLVSAYLALSCRDRSVVGVDIDERKLVLARAAAAELAPGEASLHYASSHDGAVPPGPWDAIVIVDVLYLIEADLELALLDACVAELAPGGVLVVKETDVVPRLKHAIARSQEVLATRVLRITEGDSLSFTPISELAGHLVDQGLGVTVRRVDAGYPHPHAMLVARKGGGSGG